jgi:TolB-like protein/tetratricopeptide (TPR) repeat protein
MLYEMLTGRPAFQGQSSLDTMQAILTQPVPPLPAVAGASAEVTAELQRIIAKCTAKDADDRFQGMKDLVVDLRGVRRRLESAQTSAVAVPGVPQARTRTSRGSRFRILTGAVLAAAAVVAAALWWTGRRPLQPAANPSGKPAVAVLYFANNTGDTSLDWMRTGLTDMMVTDLSQSTEIEVLGTDRLVQILQDLKRSDDRVMSADVVQEIARRSGVDKVLVGSYVRAGGTIRISARLQDAQTGRIESAERVEGPGESSLFALVDELTRRFKSKMVEMVGGRMGTLLPRPGEAPEPGLDRGLIDVTTPSIEAYKNYAEGINFHERGLSAQAAPLLEKAIALDPNFGMAYAKLAVVNNNVGLFDKRDEYAKRALDLSSRLTTRERYYIEGFYYGLRPETIGRSIEAYQQGLKLHPEHEASRHNLGLHFLFLERFPEGIEQYEELLRRGTSNPTTYENLTTMLVETGNIPRARQIAEDFVRREPDSAVGLRVLGSALEAEGRLDDARGAFTKAAALAPDFGNLLGRGWVGLLQERWADAEAVSAQFLRSPNPFDRFLGLNVAAQVAGAHGKGRALVDAWERASRLAGLSLDLRAAARNRQALMLLRQRLPAPALAQAELALVDARGRDQEFETLQLLAVAQAEVGRKADSEKTLALLESRAKILPSNRETRRLHWARGEIALATNDADTAMAELAKATAMLPVHGPTLGPPTAHPDIWLAAASAYIKGGHDAEAALLLERLQSGHERVFGMEAYARSFFLLGQILERRGDAAGARRQYAHFLDLWRDGDLEREWVQEAEKKLGSK